MTTMTTAEARKRGYEITRGSYRTTTDDRMDRWYIDPVDGLCDRRGKGFATRKEALETLTDRLATRG